MTLEQNIKAILECNFSIAKDEVIEAATKRIMEQIERQNLIEYVKVDVESMVSALEREEYAEDGCGGYVIPAYKVYAILHKYIKENGDG